MVAPARRGAQWDATNDTVSELLRPPKHRTFRTNGLPKKHERLAVRVTSRDWETAAKGRAIVIRARARGLVPAQMARPTPALTSIRQMRPICAGMGRVHDMHSGDLADEMILDIIAGKVVHPFCFANREVRNLRFVILERKYNFLRHWLRNVCTLLVPNAGAKLSQYDYRNENVSKHRM